METGYAEGTAALFSLIDGTTSLYLSSGGGIIGGGAYETVRDASAEFIKAGDTVLEHLKPTRDGAFAEPGETLFYALTDAGVFSGCALELTLATGYHPLSGLFLAGQEVLTQLRLISGE
jgi:hypothetical protein